MIREMNYRLALFQRGEEKKDPATQYLNFLEATAAYVVP
jgi:hypothetical protein